MKKSILFAATAVAAASMATPAAALTVLLEGTADDPLGTRFIYGGTYAVDPDKGTTSETVIPGSRFVIFDFAGYVDGTITSGNPNVAASVEMVTSGMVLPPDIVDDPNLVNLVFTWVGAPFTPDPTYSFTGYSAVSIYNGIDNDVMVFSSTTQNTRNGSPLYMEGFIGGPVASIPEPTTWAMMVLGFGMVGVGMKSRQRRRFIMA